MKNRKKLAIAMALSLSLGLVACGGNAENKAATPSESVEEVETAEEETTELNEAAEDATDATETEEEVVEEEATEEAGEGIYALNFGYLPEGYVENFNDEKKDLHTVEYVAEKNPASKIQIQISDNADRFAELVTVPEDAEEITIGEDTAKFWDDGAFNYLVTQKGDNHIYARSTLDPEETKKVVEEIK